MRGKCEFSPQDVFPLMRDACGSVGNENFHLRMCSFRLGKPCGCVGKANFHFRMCSRLCGKACGGVGNVNFHLRICSL